LVVHRFVITVIVVVLVPPAALSVAASDPTYAGGEEK